MAMTPLQSGILLLLLSDLGEDWNKPAETPFVVAGIPTVSVEP
jgi:hypothetical protein